MGTQLIFCVETNKQCKSDQIYIRDTIERFNREIPNLTGRSFYIRLKHCLRFMTRLAAGIDNL